MSLDNPKKRTIIARNEPVEIRKCKKRRCSKSAGKNTALCPMHHKRAFAEKYPLKYSFDNLRNRARQRGIPFNLTYAEYERFCNETGYGDNKGRRPESLTIDRIDCTKGYEISNMQVLTKSDNSTKRHIEYQELRESGLHVANPSEPDPF